MPPLSRHSSFTTQSSTGPGSQEHPIDVDAVRDDDDVISIPDDDDYDGALASSSSVATRTQVDREKFHSRYSALGARLSSDDDGWRF